MTSWCLLSPKLNRLIHHLASFTIIKIKDYFVAEVDSKKVLVMLDVEVITSGQLVGVKLGNPAQMGSDGKIPQPAPRVRGEVEVRWEPRQRADTDNDLEEAMDQLSDLEL